MLRGSFSIRCFSSDTLSSWGWERMSSVLSSSFTRHSIGTLTAPSPAKVSLISMPSPSYSSTLTLPEIHSMSMERKPFSCTTSAPPSV